MMKKLIRSVALILALVTVFLVPVSADDFDNTGAWVNVLDYATLNDSGYNYISFTNSITVRFDTKTPSLAHFIDIVVNTSGSDISSASVNGNSLNVVSLDSQVFRIYGSIPYITTGIFDLDFTANGTCYLEFLQFHVAGQWRLTYEEIGTLTVGSSSYTMSSSVSSVKHIFTSDSSYGAFLASVSCPNWKKYDYIDFYVTCFTEGLDSVSARFNGLDIPLSVSYLGGSNGILGAESYDRILVRLDVRGLDRTVTNYPVIEFSGVFDSVNNNNIVLVKVTGSVFSDSLNPIYFYFQNLSNHITSLFATLADRQDAYHEDLALWNADMYSLQLNNWNWLNDNLGVWFGDIVSSVDHARTTIIEKLTSVQNGIVSKLNTLQTTMVTWFSTISDQLDELLHPDTSGSEQFEDDIASQATEMEDISETLDSVTKPPVEDLDPSVDDIVSPADVENYTSILGILLGNNIFLSVCLMSFTLALVSYTLYGKR